MDSVELLWNESKWWPAKSLHTQNSDQSLGRLSDLIV